MSFYSFKLILIIIMKSKMLRRNYKIALSKSLNRIVNIYKMLAMRQKILFLITFIIIGRLDAQILHHQSIGVQSYNSNSKNIKVLQSVGQIQVIGNKKNNQFIVFEGFQQPLNYEFIKLDKNNISVYPIPTTGLINIDFQEKISAPVQLSFHDLSGRFLKSYHIEGQEEALIKVDVSELSNAQYLLNIQYKKKSQIFKITKIN